MFTAQTSLYYKKGAAIAGATTANVIRTNVDNFMLVYTKAMYDADTELKETVNTA